MAAPACPDRAALTGIIFVLKSGIPWEMLPQEMGCGSGMTCWRRLRDWQATASGRPSITSSSIASAKLARSTGRAPASTVPASRPKGGRRVGPNPTDRGKPGTKRHILTERGGLPLATLLTGANRHESVVFEDDARCRASIKQPNGPRRKRPDKLHADKAYDIPRCRRALSQRHIQVRIARKGIDSSETLGRHRWVVERTLAWLEQYRRLTIRYERRADIHDAFLTLGCALICFKAPINGFDRCS